MITVEELSARAEIEDLLRRYCRAVDRRDEAAIASVYHPGALDHRPYGAEGGLTATGEQVAARALRSFEGVTGFSQHHLTTVTVRIDLAAGRAAAESYVLAFHPMRRSEGGERLRVVGGRYLDLLEIRDGRWGITRRSMVVDWSRDDQPGEVCFEGLAQALRPGAGAADPSAALVPALDPMPVEGAGAVR